MAVASRNGVDVVANDVSGRQTPSAVFFARDHRLIGEHTTGHAGGNPSNLVHRIKALLDDADTDAEADDATDISSRGLPVSDSLQTQQRHLGSPTKEDGQSGQTAEEIEQTTVSPVSAMASPKPQFFCETRRADEHPLSTPADTTTKPASGGRADVLAVVHHMEQELELSASEVIACLMRHCADVVAREAFPEGGGKSAGRGESEAETVASSCAVASVPSYFSLKQRRAVLDAASIAGLSMPMVRIGYPDRRLLHALLSRA